MFDINLFILKILKCRFFQSNKTELLWLTLSDSTCLHSRPWPAGWARTQGRDDGGRWRHSGRWFHPHCHWFPHHNLQNIRGFIHNLIPFTPYLTYFHPPVHSKFGSCKVKKLAINKFAKWPTILALFRCSVF